MREASYTLIQMDVLTKVDSIMCMRGQRSRKQETSLSYAALQVTPLCPSTSRSIAFVVVLLDKWDNEYVGRGNTSFGVLRWN